MTTRPYKAATESARAEWTPEVREFRERLGEQLTVEAPCPAESRGLCASPYCDGTAAVSAPDLDAIRARAEGGTEGTWTVDRQTGQIWANPGEPVLVAQVGWAEDADFIAHAREDVPALLAALAAAHAENKMLTDDIWQAAQMQCEVEDERDEARAALAALREAAEAARVALTKDFHDGPFVQEAFDILRAALAAAPSETEEGR